MHKAMLTEKNEGMRFFAEDVNERAIKKYYLLTASALNLLIQHNTNHGLKNCFYEIMPSSNCTYNGADKHACAMMLKYFGTRLYLDVEFPADADFVDFGTSEMEPLAIGKNIAKDLHTFLETTFNCKCELIILKSHRANKFSWHMIAKIVKEGKEQLFTDSLCVLTVVNEWFEKHELEKYNYYKGDHEENAVDVSVYATHKLYRTMHSTKFKVNVPLQFATYYPIREHCIPPPFEDTLCLQSVVGREILPTKPTESSTKLKSHVPSKKRKKTSVGTSGCKKQHITTEFNQAAEMFFNNWSMWKEMKTFIVSKWPTVEFNKASFKSIFTVYIPLDYDFRCPMNKGSNNGKHKSNHSCLWVKPRVGLVEWRCQDLECKKNNVRKIMHFPFELNNKLKRVYTKRYCVQLK